MTSVPVSRLRAGWARLVAARWPARPGTSPGQTGQPLDERREILAALVNTLRPSSVLEIGRGSLAAEPPPEAELTVCLDATVLEGDATSYHDLVRRLLRCSTRALVVSTSSLSTCREPLPATLGRLEPEAEVYPLREAGGTTFLVLKGPPNRHPRDFRAEMLRELVDRHPHPLRLAQLRTSAWTSTGFYPNHAPRLWEYPAIADLVTELLPPGSRIADIGAGVSPLSPYLTGLGYVIDTIDPSPIRRVWPTRPDWNEWDFLDYAAAGLACRSWNCALHELPGTSTFDGCYSVSVVEHLPASDRRALFVEIGARLQPGGVAILTVDLVRGSDGLWNRNRGLEVEPAERHGSFPLVMAEISAAGFALIKADVVRNWGQVPVDIGLIVARRQSGS